MARVIFAIGGNALLTEGERPTVALQQQRADTLGDIVATLVERGNQVTVTHGNGPQVGTLIRRDELASQATRGQDEIFSLPLWLAVADSQGGIGTMLTLAIDSALSRRGVGLATAAILTHCVVDKDDPAFTHPTKPIGTAVYAADAPDDWCTIAAGDKVRRVVASPKPLRVLEAGVIEALTETDAVVVAGGGGGIPVVAGPSGWEAVDAVIDKDRTSALLGTEIGAGTLVLVTGVPQVYVGWGTADQRALDRLTADRAAQLLAAGEFPAGSMGPKIEAALQFLQGGGTEVIITDIESVPQALQNEAGTHIFQSTQQHRTTTNEEI